MDRFGLQTNLAIAGPSNPGRIQISASLQSFSPELGEQTEVRERSFDSFCKSIQPDVLSELPIDFEWSPAFLKTRATRFVEIGAPLQGRALWVPTALPGLAPLTHYRGSSW